jgi:hypothetical protein
MDEVTLGPARRVLGLGFIVQYHPNPEVLGNYLLPICVGAGRPGNSRYLC